MTGMEMGLIPLPCHKLELDCDLVQGVVTVGLCPALPIDEVHMILGNDLAGGVVWASVPSPVVVSQPVGCEWLDESDLMFPDVFPVCTVTRTQCCGLSAPVNIGEYLVPLPDLPFSVSREDWVRSQKADSSVCTMG